MDLTFLPRFFFITVKRRRMRHFSLSPRYLSLFVLAAITHTRTLTHRFLGLVLRAASGCLRQGWYVIAR